MIESETSWREYSNNCWKDISSRSLTSWPQVHFGNQGENTNGSRREGMTMFQKIERNHRWSWDQLTIYGYQEPR